MKLFSHKKYFLRFLLLIMAQCHAKPVQPLPHGWFFDGERVIRITIARDPESQARGLMFRTFLPSISGMLFVFDPPIDANFWMRNTLIPLDMRFYDARGRVLSHYPAAKPCWERQCPLYPAHGRAAFVLETRGNFHLVPQPIPPLRLLLQD